MRLPWPIRDRSPKQRRSVVAVALLIALSTACSTTPPPQTALIAASAIEMFTVELRLRVYGFAEEFVNGIIRAADEILESTDDATVARNALRWKINTLVTAQMTAFGLDPFWQLSMTCGCWRSRCASSWKPAPVGRRSSHTRLPPSRLVVGWNDGRTRSRPPSTAPARCATAFDVISRRMRPRTRSRT